MGKRQREWARKERRRLVALLGGHCQRCGEFIYDQLEFHHTVPRAWVANHTSSCWRVTRYKQDIEAGIVILLCKKCNKAVGPPPPPEGVDAPF